MGFEKLDLRDKVIAYKGHLEEGIIVIGNQRVENWKEQFVGERERQK